MAVREEQLNVLDERFRLDTLKCKGDTDIRKKNNVKSCCLLPGGCSITACSELLDA